MTALFEPLTLKGVTLRNRIAVSPMCQYSAEDGLANGWHAAHLAGLARGGAGLVTIEATAVSPEGRITPGDLGLWNDDQAKALAPIVSEIKAQGAVAGLQLAHAGRKASANKPWEGDDSIPEGDPRGWETLAASAIAMGGGLSKVPRAMTLEDIARVQADFVAAAERARDIGVQWLNLHFAHGYLATSFLSPHANQRDDQYGGAFENRARFVLETFAAVRAVWPQDRPLTVRLGVVDFDGNDAQNLIESVSLLNQLKALGLDAVDASIAFASGASSPPWGPNFMAPFAERVRRETGLPVTASWFISQAKAADAMVADGQVDYVTLGRPLLANPHWPYSAALELGAQNPAWSNLPAPYAYWLDRYAAA